MSTSSSRPWALFLVGRDALHRGAAGGDLQAWEWARHLGRQGWRVVYVCQSDDGLEAAQRVDGVDVRRLGRGASLLVRAWWLHRRYRDRWSLVYEDPIGGGRAPYFSPLYAKAPVIAVWHQVSAALLRAIRGPVAATPFVLAERMIALFYRRCWFWAPSVESADAVAGELRLPRARIAVIPPTLGADVHMSPSSSGARRPAVFVALGVIRPYKRFFDAVEAMPVVLAQLPDARLVIAGRVSDPADVQVLHDRIDALGVSHAVEVRTNLSDAERQTLLARATALVLPSLLEGFGIVTIEANAEGTPVIASEGVPTGAVMDGANGLRFPVGEVDRLATAMIRLGSEGDLWSSLSEGARRQVESLTVAAVAPRFDALVEHALSERT